VSLKKPINPFYPALIVVGTAFAITACAYGVMTVRMLSPEGAHEAGMVQFMDKYGLMILLGELVLLGLFTFAAMGTDDYWTKRAEAASHEQRKDQTP
jgi:hypothetical protein